MTFDWYESDAKTLREAVTYLRTVSGDLLIITNELGQRGKSPAEAADKLDVVRNLGLGFAI